MRRKVRETIQEIIIGFVLGVVLMASFLFFGLRVKAAPVYNELAYIPRHEIIDMMRRDDYHEPEWVNPLYPYEMELLAALVWSEAGDQPLPDGLCYVCDVVLNRRDSPAWPSTIEGVIMQPGQFSVVSNGALDRVYGNVPQVCYDAIISQLQNRWNYDIIYFSMNYLANGQFAFVHGTHWFGY